MRRLATLQEFIVKLSPRYVAPVHLAPLTELFERVASGEEVHAAVACPPRHGKTEVVTHAIPWLLRRKPSMRIAYVSYAQALAAKKSRSARARAERARVRLDPRAASLHDWRTGVEEGGVWATSIGGSIVGEGFDLILIDDPIKDRVAAESSLIRDRTHEWYTDTLLPRLEPGGSLILIMHRWHRDDLAQRIVDDGAEEIRLPAIDEAGNALWPERYSAERLLKIREKIGSYGWQALYQGEPRSRGGSLFDDLHFYDSIPEGARYVIGADLAYTVKTHADYSVAVVLAEKDGVRYVVHVERKQVQAPDFAATLAGLQHAYENAPIFSYVAGTERGAVDFMLRSGVAISALNAREDKFTRAQLTAAAWNVGRVRVPREAKWLNAFVSEIVSFTGVKDRNDDQVDALVSAFDARARKTSVASARMVQALKKVDLDAFERRMGVRRPADLHALGIPREIAIPTFIKH